MSALHPNLPESEQERRQERALMMRAMHATQLERSIAARGWIAVRSEIPPTLPRTYWTTGRAVMSSDDFLHLEVFDPARYEWVRRAVAWDWITDIKILRRAPGARQLQRLGIWPCHGIPSRRTA